MFMKLLISGAVAAVCEPSLGEGRSLYTRKCVVRTPALRLPCADPGGDGRPGCRMRTFEKTPSR